MYFRAHIAQIWNIQAKSNFFLLSTKFHQLSESVAKFGKKNFFDLVKSHFSPSRQMPPESRPPSTGAEHFWSKWLCRAYVPVYLIQFGIKTPIPGLLVRSEVRGEKSIPFFIGFWGVAPERKVGSKNGFQIWTQRPKLHQTMWKPKSQHKLYNTPQMLPGLWPRPHTPRKVRAPCSLLQMIASSIGSNQKKILGPYLI